VQRIRSLGLRRDQPNGNKDLNNQNRQGSWKSEYPVTGPDHTEGMKKGESTNI
jgi:hypothetical protein